MKWILAVVLVLVLGGTSEAQMGGGPAVSPQARVEARLAQIEQEVDETLLREAMLKLARLELGWQVRHLRSPDVINEDAAEIEALKSIIKVRRAAILERAESTTPKPAAPAGSPRVPSDPVAVEKLRNQVQLLQVQLRIGENQLDVAINQLAQVEFLNRGEPGGNDQEAAARQNFARIEAALIAVRKQLARDSARLDELDPDGTWRGLGTSGGTMGGIGGGMR